MEFFSLGRCLSSLDLIHYSSRFGHSRMSQRHPLGTYELTKEIDGFSQLTDWASADIQGASRGLRLGRSPLAAQFRFVVR